MWCQMCINFGFLDGLVFLPNENMDFAIQIIEWYKVNKRDLPWRETSNPYFIWLSEIILQQTQVKQGMPYYLKFVKHYPSVEKLANASEQEVLNDWQGLGYYSRARNLHAAAKQVMKDFNGVFPSTYKDILSLKGVGDYTASAIASFAFNEKQAVLDGNVFRVLSRYLDIDEDISNATIQKKFKQLAVDFLPDKEVDTYNQAIMELGALVCTKHLTKCDECPVKFSCLALKNKTVSQRPVKLKKTKQRKRYFNYICLDDGDSTVLKKRTKKDIWQNMYEFPLIESEQGFENDRMVLEEAEKYGLELSLENQFEQKHQLSHQTIYAKLYYFKTKKIIQEKVSWTDLDEIPVSRLIDKMIGLIKE